MRLMAWSLEGSSVVQFDGSEAEQLLRRYGVPLGGSAMVYLQQEGPAGEHPEFRG